MVLRHPHHTKCKRVKHYEWLKIRQLESEGWVMQPLPKRTPAQKEASKRWMNSGQLARTAANLQDCIRRERNSLNAEQLKILNRAEIVLQQLSKKYRPKQT